MIMRAELNCMNCGYEIGEVEGDASASYKELTFLAVHQGDRLVADEKGRIRCPRCAGRVLPQGVTPVCRPLDPATLLEAKISDVDHNALMW